MTAHSTQSQQLRHGHDTGYTFLLRFLDLQSDVRERLYVDYFYHAGGLE